MVWAKVDGYPWWPGFVLSQNAKKTEIMFFDDFTRAFLSASKVRPFDDAEMESLKAKSIYGKALQQIARVVANESTIEEEKER